MQNIFDIHDFDENFLERFTSQTIPIYDLWSVRPLQNEQKELISGTSEEQEKFRSFFHEHSNQDYPHPLVIIVGNAEKNNSKMMLNLSKRYFKIKFDKFKGNDIGTPLSIAGAPQPYPENAQMPFSFMGFGDNKSVNTNPLQSFSLGDIHGIIDRNVADATRSIKAEYEEQSARREAENIKRLAELETRMEMYKLELREKEVADREQELRQELEELERKKIEAMGTVKDYTKTIAGGLFELGKTAFGLEDSEGKNEIKAKTEVKAKVKDLRSTAFDDDGFTEIKDEELNIKDDKDNLDVILQGIVNLDEEQKMALLDALLPEEEIKNDELKIKDDISHNSQIAVDTEQTKEIKDKNLNIKNDEKIQVENTD